MNNKRKAGLPKNTCDSFGQLPKESKCLGSKLARDGLLNLMFTTPCSPFTNLIESVFNLVKRRLRRSSDYPFR